MESRVGGVKGVVGSRGGGAIGSPGVVGSRGGGGSKKWWSLEVMGV